MNPSPLTAIASAAAVSQTMIAEVATHLAGHFRGDNEGWRSTAEVAEALELSILEARVRLNAVQIAGLCDCRVKWGVYFWRVRVH